MAGTQVLELPRAAFPEQALAGSWMTKGRTQTCASPLFFLMQDAGIPSGNSTAEHLLLGFSFSVFPIHFNKALLALQGQQVSYTSYEQPEVRVSFTWS